MPEEKIEEPRILIKSKLILNFKLNNKLCLIYF